MIIRYSQKDKDEINRVIKPLEEEHRDLLSRLLSLPEDHFTIIDGLTKPTSEEANDLIRRENECRERLWKASNDLYNSIEDRRFNSLSSRQRIIADAHTQTDAIIEHLIKALKLAERDVKDPLQIQKDIAPLTKIWNAKIIRSIQASGGDTTKLDASLIIDLIKKDLHRHYGKLNSQDKKELTEYIKQTVTKAIPQPKKLPSGYFKAFYDKHINAISYLNSQFIEPTIYKDGQSKEILPGITVGDFTFYFENIDETLIKLGVETHKIILYAVSIFTKQKPKDNIVYFSLNDYLNETRPDLPPTRKRIYKKRLEQYIDTIPTITIPYIRRIPKGHGKKGYITSKGRLALFPRAETDTTNMGLIEFKDEIAKNIKKSSVAQYPRKIFHIKANDPNTYRIALALSERYSNFKNVINGTETIIGINTLWQKTNLPTPEETDSHYKRDIIEVIEGSLNKLRDTYGILKSWYYIRPKRGEETPQERRLSGREVEEIRSDLLKWRNSYIAFEMEEEIPNLADKAKEYQKIQETKLLEKREKEAIKAAKALEKIEGKTNSNGLRV